MSLQESIYHGVPILGLPLTYEQNLNARIVRDKHIGTIINYREVDEDTLENEIKGLLENQTVRVNVAKLSSLVNDSRTSPVETAVWWGEYVMRHRGCGHLQSPHRHDELARYGLAMLCSKIIITLLGIYFTISYIMY